MTTIRTLGYLPEIFSNLMKSVNESNTTPAMNIIENEYQYIVEIAAPGMTKENFDLHLEKDTYLVINITNNKDHQTENEHSSIHYLRKDFSYRISVQTLILPDDVAKDRITAKVEHGILRITLSKLTEQDNHRNAIKIAVA